MPDKVGIGQYRVLQSQGVLAAYGLGSCIGLFLYDPGAKIGGLAHIMLPGSKPESLAATATRYAEHAIEAMLDEMIAHGAMLRRIGAILVGGAHMFREACGDTRNTIGQKNQDSVQEILRRRSIPVRATELGGEIGRTMEAAISTGDVTVRTFQAGARELKWQR